MKGRPKITKFQLDDKTKEVYSFLGIVSTEADYKLSFLLNKKLKIALKNTKPIETKEGKESNLSFSRFSYSSVSHEIKYNLISNKSEKNYLLKKLKNIDYFFQIHCFGNKCDVELLTGSIREMEMITAVFVLDPDKIKDKNLSYLTL